MSAGNPFEQTYIEVVSDMNTTNKRKMGGTKYSKSADKALKGNKRSRDVTRGRVGHKGSPHPEISSPSLGSGFAGLVEFLCNKNISNQSQMNRNKSDVDRLSVFLERVATDLNDEKKKEEEVDMLYKIKLVIEAVLNFIFTTDKKFSTVFEAPIPGLGTYDGIDTLIKTNNDNYKVRLFLKKFTHPGSCIVSVGAQADMPPGVAVCQLSDRLTAEERSVVHNQWSLCMDQEGLIAPQLIFPWFANVFVKAVKSLAEPTGSDDDDDEPEDEEEWRKKAESNPWLGIHAYADFPSVHVLLPKKRKRRQKTKEKEEEEESPQPLLDDQDDRPPLTRDGASDAGDQVGEDKTAEPDDDEKSFTSGDGIEPNFVTVTVTPCLEGWGWVKGIKLQHALPKTRPYADKGVNSLKDFADKLDDGQPMWLLEASPSDFSSSSAQLSPRFRCTFRRIGSSGCFWNFSLAPTIQLLESHMMQACKDSEFPFDMDIVKASLLAVRNYHKWECISPQVISTAVLWVAKRHLANLKTLGTCFLKVLQFIKNVARSQSCPNFLMPNCNIAGSMELPDALKVMNDVEKLIEEIKEDESVILRYGGFEKKKQKKKK